MSYNEWQILRKFVSKVKERFPDAQVILFGSRVKKEFLKDSDFDIVIISDSFKDIHFLKRLEILNRMWYDCWKKEESFIGADILAYTYEEFEKKKQKICIIKEVLKEGILL